MADQNTQQTLRERISNLFRKRWFAILVAIVAGVSTGVGFVLAVFGLWQYYANPAFRTTFNQYVDGLWYGTKAQANRIRGQIANGPSLDDLYQQVRIFTIRLATLIAGLIVGLAISLTAESDLWACIFSLLLALVGLILFLPWNGFRRLKIGKKGGIKEDWGPALVLGLVIIGIALIGLISIYWPGFMKYGAKVAVSIPFIMIILAVLTRLTAGKVRSVLATAVAVIIIGSIVWIVYNGEFPGWSRLTRAVAAESQFQASKEAFKRERDAQLTIGVIFDPDGKNTAAQIYEEDSTGQIVPSKDESGNLRSIPFGAQVKYSTAVPELKVVGFNESFIFVQRKNASGDWVGPESDPVLIVARRVPEALSPGQASASSNPSSPPPKSAPNVTTTNLGSSQGCVVTYPSGSCWTITPPQTPPCSGLSSVSPSVTISDDGLTATLVVPATAENGVIATDSSGRAFNVGKGDEIEVTVQQQVGFAKDRPCVGPKGLPGWYDPAVDSPFKNHVGGLEFSIGALAANRFLADGFKGVADYSGTPIFRVIERYPQGYHDDNSGGFLVTIRIVKKAAVSTS